MAIIKSIDTQYGIAAEYWKIIRVDEYFAEMRATVILAAYVNQEARESGKVPLATAATVEMTGDTYLPDATRTQLYDYIKSLPDFAGSEDA